MKDATGVAFTMLIIGWNTSYKRRDTDVSAAKRVPAVTPSRKPETMRSMDENAVIQNSASPASSKRRSKARTGDTISISC